MNGPNEETPSLSFVCKAADVGRSALGDAVGCITDESGGGAGAGRVAAAGEGGELAGIAGGTVAGKEGGGVGIGEELAAAAEHSGLPGQSVQSWHRSHESYSAPGPPSSHSPSPLYWQKSSHVVGLTSG